MKYVDKELLPTLALLVLVVLLAAVMMSAKAHAQDLRLLDADEISMDTFKLDKYSDGYFQSQYGQPWENEGKEKWSWGTRANLNLTMLQYDKFHWYFNNEITGISTDAQFRKVSWAFKTQFEVAKKIGIFYRHLSEHALDQAVETPQAYPLQDSYGVQLIWVKK